MVCVSVGIGSRAGVRCRSCMDPFAAAGFSLNYGMWCPFLGDSAAGAWCLDYFAGEC